MAHRRALGLIVVLLAGTGLGFGVTTLTAQSDRPPRVTRVRPARASPATQPAPARATSKNTATEDPTAILGPDASASFAQLATTLPGRVELTIAPLGTDAPVTLGGDSAAHGWSTTKVVVLTALLRARHEVLTPDEQSWAESAITESNNQSVLHLFHALERLEGGLDAASNYAQELLRKSGDEETVIATAPPPPGAVTTFGQTEWTPSNAVKFFSALARGCLLAPDGTAYIIGLMQHIEPSESWGLGSAGFTTAAFKGGWGPEASGAYLVRQSGIIDVGTANAIATTIIAFPPAGAASFETGTIMLTRVARWLHRHLVLTQRRNAACG